MQSGRLFDGFKMAYSIRWLFECAHNQSIICNIACHAKFKHFIQALAVTLKLFNLMTMKMPATYKQQLKQKLSVSKVFACFWRSQEGKVESQLAILGYLKPS